MQQIKYIWYKIHTYKKKSMSWLDNCYVVFISLIYEWKKLEILYDEGVQCGSVSSSGRKQATWLYQP